MVTHPGLALFLLSCLVICAASQIFPAPEPKTNDLNKLDQCSKRVRTVMRLECRRVTPQFCAAYASDPGELAFLNALTIEGVDLEAMCCQRLCTRIQLRSLCCFEAV